MNKVHFTTLFSEEALQDALDRKLVNKRKHPTLPIWIYNYSAVTQFSWEWSPVTLNCRGLVLDADGYIVARSLPKFFSYEQLDGKLPEGDFIVEEKLDGSMLLVFSYGGEVVTATRGSFESEQALAAKRFLPKNLIPSPDTTFVFEYISKENRIVVNYDYEGLVLLSIVKTDGTEITDLELTFLKNYFVASGFRFPKVYSFESLEEILNYKEDNIEGFVLRYSNGERVKVKLEDYKRLHRLLTGLNERDIWEALKNGTFDQLLEEIPDEMYEFVCNVREDLQGKFDGIKVEAMSAMKDFGNRKDNALYYQTQKYPAVMFYLLDGKPVDDLIYKMIRPKVVQTYKVVSEDSN